MNQQINSNAIEIGTPVFDAVGENLGPVEAVTATTLRVKGHEFPLNTIARADTAGIHLHLAHSALGATAPRASQDNTVVQNDDKIIIPLAEERLKVGTREVDLGEVIIRKRVVEEERMVPVTFRREEIEVLRRAPGETWNLDNPPEGTEVTRIPLQGWEPVVATEAVVTREAVIDKTRLAEESQVVSTVRREQATIDEQYAQARPSLERSFLDEQQATTTSSTRTYGEAEPHHRAGFAAGSDPQYADRDFEAVEPALRQQYQMAGDSTNTDWDQLRREIRAGFEAARRRD